MKSDLFKLLAWWAATASAFLFVVAGRCWSAVHVYACVASCVLGVVHHFVFFWALDKYADAKSEEGQEERGTLCHKK